MSHDEDVVGSGSGSSFGLAIDLLHKVEEGIVSRRALETVLGGRGLFPNPTKELYFHENVWRRDIKVEADFSGIKLPETQSGFEAIGVIPKFDINELWEACRREFSAHNTRGNDLKSLIASPDRSLQGGYAFLHKGEKAADDQLKLSAIQIAEKMKSRAWISKNYATMDLGGRLIWEWVYHILNPGEHLDTETFTLTSTYAEDGCFAWVYWCDGELLVYWGHPGVQGASLRARQVVVS